MQTLKNLNTLEPLTGLVLLIGPPGAGKSTFAQKLVVQQKLEDESYISNDKIAKDLFGVTVDRGDKDGAIFEEQDRRIASLLQLSKAAIVDATNIKPEARRRIIAIAKKSEAPVSAFCFNRDEATLLSQNKGREVEVPEEMVQEYAALMRLVTEEQLNDEGIGLVIDVPQDMQS
jgi:predicted kinase